MYIPCTGSNYPNCRSRRIQLCYRMRALASRLGLGDLAKRIRPISWITTPKAKNRGVHAKPLTWYTPRRTPDICHTVAESNPVEASAYTCCKSFCSKNIKEPKHNSSQGDKITHVNKPLHAISLKIKTWSPTTREFSKPNPQKHHQIDFGYV